MTPEEARDQLAVIRDVIARARVERSASGAIYVAWGVVLVVCIAATLGADLAGWPYGWVSFPVLCTLTGIWTGFYARSRGLKRDTYAGRVEGTVYAAVGAAIFVLVFVGLATGALPLAVVIPVVSALTGVAVTTSGALFEHRLLKLSGAAFLLLPIPALFLEWRLQYAVFAVALVLGYIVPGVILMKQERDAG